MKGLISLIFLASLAACATKPLERPEPIIVTKEVPVPVAQPCVPDTLGPAPEYVDSKEALKAKGDKIDERLQLLYAGRAQREARLNELEPVVAACPRGKSK